jgi:predicted transcriptional regulator
MPRRSTQPSSNRAPANLRALRRALGLTQWDVAERARCAQSTVAKVERGRPVDPELIRRIAGALLDIEAERGGKR